MPDAPAIPKPSLCRTSTTLSLHFSWHETQSCMDLRQPDALSLEYTRTMMGFLLFVPEPANIAMVGLGGGSLAKFCYRHLPTARIQVVEINPHVIALREEFALPPDDRRLTVILGDGAGFVRSQHGTVDVLLIDGYDHQGLPRSLSSQRFYSDCHDMLTSGGILVVNLHCNNRHRQRQVERIRRSFNENVLVVRDDDGSNTIIFASRKRLSARPYAVPGSGGRGRSKEAEAWTALRSSFSRVLAATPAGAT